MTKLLKLNRRVRIMLTVYFVMVFAMVVFCPVRFGSRDYNFGMGYTWIWNVGTNRPFGVPAGGPDHTTLDCYRLLAQVAGLSAVLAVGLVWTIPTDMRE